MGRKRPPPAPQPAPQAGPLRWLRNRWLAGAAVLLALLGLAAWLRPADAPARSAAAPAAQPAAALSYGQQATGAAMLQPATRAQRVRELTEQFKLADHTYCSYREGSKYPVSSRPIADNPDQVYPNQPVTESHPMRAQGGGSDRDVQVQTAQSRVFLGAGESAVFSVRAVDANGKTLNTVVTRATATGLTYQDKRPTASVVLPFLDDGRNGDATAGDGAHSGVLTPSRSGLASFNGTIRTEVNYTVNGRRGVVVFDVIHTPEVPAVWAGPIRDVMENGALSFILKADIRQAGRYVVHGRVDDAKGKPFALLSFNELLPAGLQEIRLTAFGKLVRDQQPAMPLTLRDVDAYLLKEDTDPDRALMPRIEGTAHVSKNYTLKGFSDAEWQAEERTRYLTEYGKDVSAARAALEQISIGGPMPPSECL